MGTLILCRRNAAFLLTAGWLAGMFSHRKLQTGEQHR